MIPFLRTPTGMPVASGTSEGISPASSMSRSPKELGTAPAGRFDEVFASMFPTAQAQGNRGAALASDAETTEAGQPAVASREVSALGSTPTESKTPGAQATPAIASDIGLVMSQRAQHPTLSANAVLPPTPMSPSDAGSKAPAAAESALVLETRAEVAAAAADAVGWESSDESAAVVYTPGSGPRTPFPVAVAPLLVLPFPGADVPPKAAQLPVAKAPLLVVPMPESGGSIPVAPTPWGEISAPALPATAGQQALAAPAGPEAEVDTNGTVIASGEPVSSSPAAVIQAQGLAPSSVPAVAQREPASAGEALTGKIATTLAGADAAPAAPNAVATRASVSAGSEVEAATAPLAPGTNGTVITSGEPASSTPAAGAQIPGLVPGSTPAAAQREPATGREVLAGKAAMAPVAPGTNGISAASGQLLSSSPATVVHALGIVPGSTPAAAQREPVSGGETPTGTAVTASVGTDAAPAAPGAVAAPTMASAGSEPEAARDPVAPGTNGISAASGQLLSSSPATVVHAHGLVPGSTPAAAQREPVSGGETPTGTAVTASVGTDAAPAAPGAVAAPTMASAGSEPEAATDPVAPGTNGTSTASGQPLSSSPATVVHAHGLVPGSVPATAQREPVSGGETPTGTAVTAPVDAEAATASANAVTTPATTTSGQSVAQAVPQGIGQAQVSPADTMASARNSTDVGVSAVSPLETTAVDGPMARTQAPAPLHRQLLGPIATLAAGPNGERTLSVNIAPEALGPITVKAHLGGDGIRMELSAPTDAGREALRAMLPELRRELAGMGSGAITVGTGQDSSATQGGHAGNQNAGGSDARSSTGTAAPPMRTRDEPAIETPGQDTPPVQHAPSHLDVMA